MAVGDIPWSGRAVTAKLFLQSAYTSTVKTSLGFADPRGVSLDTDSNTPACEVAGTDSLQLLSGQFTSTSKSTLGVGSDIPEGISVDTGPHTPWVKAASDKLMHQSGQITSTVKTSVDISSVETDSQGISTDSDGHIPWCGASDNKFYRQSVYTTTLKTSLSVTADPMDISFDGTDTPAIRGATVDKILRHSGQFTSTIKDSVDITSINSQPTGIEVNDFNSRLGIAAAAAAPAIAFGHNF